MLLGDAGLETKVETAAALRGFARERSCPYLEERPARWIGERRTDPAIDPLRKEPASSRSSGN